MQLLFGFLVRSLTGLGGDEEVGTPLLQPWPDALFRCTVRGRSIDVIDPVLEQQVQRCIGFGLRHLAERGRAENHTRAPVPSTPEIHLGDHAQRP